MDKYVKNIKEFETWKKIIYITDRPEKYNIFYNHLNREYPIVYRQISKRIEFFSVLEQTFILCIIEMIHFSETSKKLIGEIRCKSKVPILFISRTNLGIKQKEEAIYIIESGADEYFGNSLCVEEKMIKLKALIRLQNRISKKANVWHFHKLQIVPECRQIFREETEIILTKIEFDIVCFWQNKMGLQFHIKNCMRRSGIGNI